MNGLLIASGILNVILGAGTIIFASLVRLQNKTLKDACAEIQSLNLENMKYLAKLFELRNAALTKGE